MPQKSLDGVCGATEKYQCTSIWLCRGSRRELMSHCIWMTLTAHSSSTKGTHPLSLHRVSVHFVGMLLFCMCILFCVSFPSTAECCRATGVTGSSTNSLNILCSQPLLTLGPAPCCWCKIPPSQQSGRPLKAQRVKLFLKIPTLVCYSLWRLLKSEGQPKSDSSHS